MVIKKPLLVAALAVTVSISILLLGYSMINRGKGVSPRPTTSEPETTAEGLASLGSSTLTLTPASLLSIDTPTTTVTEALATAMIAMLPYSDTLLYGPVPWYSPEFRFVGTTIDSDLKRLNEVANQNETFRAFTACNPDICHEKIYIEDLGTERVFEIQFAGYMAWRPITQISWLDNDVLLFTHPTQPNYGYRYAVNINGQRLILVILVTDECFVYGKCS